MYLIGRHNGVAKQLSEEWPWLLSVHCATHRLALVCKDASEVGMHDNIGMTSVSADKSLKT